MIQSFVDSWYLFQNAYVSGWLIAALLALVGVVVVARDQIFLGAAVAQASMLGLTVGIRFGPEHVGSHAERGAVDLVHNLCGGAFAVSGALLTANRGRSGRESREAITGWLFLVGASFSVLLVAHTPHGLAEVHRLLASTIIGASRFDVIGFCGMLLISALIVWIKRDTILLVVMDPEMARALGVRVDAWNRGLAVWLGLVVALSIHVSGVVYSFGCLVLPALVAKHVCNEVGKLFLVAPLIAVASTVVGVIIANEYDYPPGQVAVAVMSMELVAAWALRRN